MTSTSLPDGLPAGGLPAKGIGAADTSEPGASYSAGRQWRARWQGFLPSVIMAVIGLAFLLPLLWLILAAFNPHATAGVSAPAFSVANFRAAFDAGAGSAIKNSLYLAGVSTIVAT